jgi:light-regulated signal transduction histidine kinase (bacteriophytochrome)
MNAELEQRVAARTLQLESANRELEAFAYAVSHDLRAPLRSMSGFSQILQETAPAGLDQRSLDYLRRIREASLRMSALIDDLLSLSRISRSELVLRAADLSQIAADAAATIRDRYAGRQVKLTIEPGMNVHGDTRLLRIAMENLLDNAWKYTAHAQQAEIIVGSQAAEGGRVFFVRDNGVGFDMAYSAKLFAPFQRLHPESEFPGTGIGLVTVQRIIARHGGRIWAQAHPGEGATFWFKLDAQ